MQLKTQLRIWRDRAILNLYPPFFFSRTRCAHIAPDYQLVRMELPRSLLTRNLHGSHFGGSIYAMCDPVHALMLKHLLGPGHIVWAKSAAIEFIKPACSTISAEFTICDEELAAIESTLADRGKTTHHFPVEVKDTDRTVTARVTVEVYIRRTQSANQDHDLQARDHV